MNHSDSHNLGFALLAELYAAYNQLAQGQRWACFAGCSVCCQTGRVLITTLEGRYLAEGLRRAGRDDLLRAAAAVPVEPAARPASSFNALARMCLARQEPPPAAGPEAAPGRCPLLQDDLCPVYDHRPLACRTMVSAEVCAPGGQAVHDQWWITLATAFFQLVEAADPAGLFGPLPAVLAAESGAGWESRLVPCEPLPGLLAPPEHQEGLSRALRPVFARPVRGRPLGLWLDEIRSNRP